MKPFVILLILFHFTSLVNAQEYDHEFGKLKQADLDLKKVPFDSAAAAVMLFDIGETKFVRSLTGGLDIQFTRSQRLKILDDSELGRANFNIYYYKDGYGKTETVEKIEANCYNYENGVLAKTSIEKSDILEAKHNDKWMVKKVAVPGARVGSIVEIKYTVTTPFLWNLPDWEFQTDIPTLSSHYKIGIVPFYEYAIISQGITKLDKFESYEETGIKRQFGSIEYRDMIYKYGQKNIPAFVDDEFITSSNDYIQKLDFQLAKVNRTDGTQKKYMSTWPAMVEDFNKSEKFGKYIKSSENLSSKSIIAQLQLQGKTDQEKAQIIAQYVKNIFRHNDFLGIYTSQRPKQVFQSKTGSVAEINLFMLGLLRAAGLRANPVLLSTREHGKIYSDYPFTSMFNYVIVQVYIGDDFILMDGTEPALPYFLLPIKCLNDHGFVMYDKRFAWVNLSSQINSTKKEIGIAKIEEGKLNFRVIEHLNKYDAWKNRTLYKSSLSAFEDAKVKEEETLIGEVSVTNADKYDATLIVKYTKEKDIDIFDGDYYLIPFDGIEYAKNPLTSKKRSYPIDLVYKKNRVFSTTIALTGKQSFKHIPENKIFDDDLLSFDYQVTTMTQFIRIDATYQFKKAIYAPEEYDVLKNDFELLYTKLSEQVVITEN